MKFIKFTENNDNEGESWNFWLQLDGNDGEIEKLKDWVTKFNEDLDAVYEFDTTPVDESEVDILVKHSGEGYMNYENKVTGVFTCPPEDVFEDEESEFMRNIFYKGDIARYFK